MRGADEIKNLLVIQIYIQIELNDLSSVEPLYIYMVERYVPLTLILLFLGQRILNCSTSLRKMHQITKGVL